MGQVFIENYRGHDIVFDTERERFSFEAGSGHWGEKQSYAAAKNGIDDYVKDNTEFKPFKIVKIDDYHRNGIKIIDVVGIRKDRRFMVKKQPDKIEQLSEYDEGQYDVFDPKNQSIYKQINEHELGTELIINERNRISKELRSKVSAKSLKEYKKTLEF